MSKKAQRTKNERLYASVADLASRSHGRDAAMDMDDDGDTRSVSHADLAVPHDVLERSPALAGVLTQESEQPRRLLRMKKFRFQLLAQWLVDRFEPCRVADIGGGKGLLAYLLGKDGWEATVIDPVFQTLPTKYKDIALERRVKIASSETVPRVTSAFEVAMAQDFDLLIGVHAHGCNMRILDAAAHYGCACLLMPCCVIDEPVCPPLGVHWLESVAYYAAISGLRVDSFRLPFKGQNIGLLSPGRLETRRA